MAQETITFGDFTLDEDPGNIGTLVLWWSPRCHSFWADAQASRATTRLFGLTSLSVSILTQDWFSRTVLETTVQSEHAWTLFLFEPHTPVSACITVIYGKTRTYHACTTSHPRT